MKKLSRTIFVVISLAILLLSSPTTKALCPDGDINNDCIVDLEDLMILAAQWLGGVEYPSAGLSGMWEFDEPSGTVAADSSGNSRDGVLNNMDNADHVEGRMGNALDFDGFNDYVAITGFKGVSGTNPRSCTAWIKTVTTDGDIITWGELGTHSYRWVFRVQEEGYLRVEVGGGYAVGSTIVNEDNWHHVAVVSDGTNTDNIKLYVDGRIDSVSSFSSKAIITAATNDVRIGVFDGSNRYFEGLIDDVAIYDRMLSPEELAIIGSLGSDINEDGIGNNIDFAVLAGNWLENRTGSVQVTINPAAAVDDGAKWRLAGGQWQDSDATITAPEGIHLLEFIGIDGWLSPDSQSVTVRAGQLSTAEMHFTEIPDSGLVISEFMAVNSYVPFINSLNLGTKVNGHPDTVYPDWIEIHNAGTSTINLEGWYLTDDENNLTKWQFPSGYTLDPDEYFVVYASTKTVEVYPGNYPFVDDLGNLHTNFAIAGNGGYLGLVKPDGQTIEHEYRDFPSQRGLITYGLANDGYGYLLQPTRQSANSGRYMGVVADTTFDVDRGYYQEPFDVSITCETEDALIRYTTDGSEPTLSQGYNYQAPINITTTTCLRAAAFKDGYLATNTDTQTYLFINDVIRQPANPAGFPTTWGSPYDYEMDPQVVDNALYSDTIEEDMKSVPAMSIVTNVDYIFGSSGIYANTNSSGIGWERPCSVEYFDADGSEEFQQNCGIRIYGGVGRNTSFEKHTFRLMFKGGYGPSKLNYPLFGKGAVESFDTLILRAGFNNAWHRHQSTEENQAQFIRDEWIRQSQLDMGRAGLHGTFVHLYVNGLYWGLYNPVERANADFGSSYFGGEKEEWDSVNSYPRNVVDGFSTAWVTAQNIASSGVSNTAGYAAMAEYVDIPNLIDYMLLNFYSGNIDWDDHNWYAVRRRKEGAGWKFLGWDSERTLESITGTNKTGVGQFNKPSYLYSALRQNPEFRLQFADHAHKYLFNDGELTPLKTRARYKKWADFIDRAIVGESARWGDSSRSTPYTRDVEWVRERDRLLNQYFPERTTVALGFLKGANLYPDTEAPVFNINDSYQHGGVAETGDYLTITNPNNSSTIYYTTDGSDPRVPAIADPGDDKTLTILTEDAPKRVLIPDAADHSSFSNTWRGGNETFDDSQWNAGTPITPGRTGGVGYDNNPTYNSYMTYDVDNQMDGVNTSCYIRIPFDVNLNNIEDYPYMTLRMRYEDGFVAFLNGERIESKNFPGDPTWDSSTGGQQNSDNAAVVFENFNVSGDRDKLKNGRNILAIHGLNTSMTSSDFLISVELEVNQKSSSAGGEVSPTAIEYTSPIALNETTHVKSRILDSEWSALNKATYSVGPIRDNLRITEIMYHPQDPPEGSSYTDEDFEFIELKNIGAEPLNPYLVRFTEGIDFTFPSLVIPAGGFIVVVSNAEAFASRYTDFSGVVAGVYTGFLDNNGETVELEDAVGLEIQKFDYSDNWHEITDGQGFALTIKDPTFQPVESLQGNLELHLSLDETSGDTTQDTSGNNRTGSLNGYPVWKANGGVFGGAIQLDGMADNIKITGYKGIIGSAPRSCTAWIKTKKQGQILSWGLSGTSGARWVMLVDSLGQLTVLVGNGYISGSSVIDDDRWHHVAVVSDGSTTDNIKLYVDGQPDTVSQINSQTINTQSYQNVAVGEFTDAPSHFSGKVDNVSIYSRLLSDTEIELLAESDNGWDEKKYWRPSVAVGGSPGQDDTGQLPPLGSVVINEVLAHSHAIDPDWIELHNTTDQPIPIGGWFLSDENDDLMMYEIAADVVIDAHSYVVFYEDIHFGNINDPGCNTPFALSENGDTVYLHSGADGMLTGYTEEEDFGASATNVTMGRYQKSTGTFNFVPLSSQTPDDDNAYPKVGPVVIGEIMYNPAVNGNAEYVEFVNISDSDVRLYDYVTNEPWRFTDSGGIEFLFPATPVTLEPGEKILLVQNLAEFNSEFTAPAGTKIFEWIDGSLGNGGERIQLSMPGDVDALGVRQYIRVDRVVYDDGNGWPGEPDGDGQSLTRITDSEYGNDVINWQSADPSPGQ